MKNVKRVLCFFVACVLLTFSVSAALPQGITSDPWTRMIKSNDPYGVLFFTDFKSQENVQYGGSGSTYGVFDFGMTAHSDRNNGKDQWVHLAADTGDYRGNSFVIKDSYGSGSGTVAAYFGENNIAGKKLNISFEARKERTVSSTSLEGLGLANVLLFSGDDGTYNITNAISGTSGHGSRRVNFIELVMDKPNGSDANGGAGSMFSGLYNGIGEGKSSAKVIGLDDTEWHRVDGVIDVTAGTTNAVVKLFVDGTEVYKKTGDFITENAFDINGNFAFNAVTLTGATSGFKNGVDNAGAWTLYDNFKITNTEGSYFGVTDVIEGQSAIYLELSSTVKAGQLMPEILLEKVGTNQIVSPAVSIEGGQAIKLDLSNIELDANSEYRVVYPADIELVDINDRSLDEKQMVTFYNDGEGAGVKKVRFVNLDNTLAMPSYEPFNSIKGIMVTLENSCTNLSVTFEDEEETLATTVTGASDEWSIGWNKFLSNTQHTLKIFADGELIYTYVFIPELGEELSVTSFALYDSQKNQINSWEDIVPGDTLTAEAVVINSTGQEKYATLIYGLFEDGYLIDVQCDPNGGSPIGTSFEGEKLEFEFDIPLTGCDEVGVFLWDSLDTMNPLVDKIYFAE